MLFRSQLAASGVVLLDDRHPALGACLTEQDAWAVLLRPDRYVMAVADDQDSWNQMLQTWPLQAISVEGH